MVFQKDSTPSNLDSFLHSTTPLVRSQFLSKSEIGNLNRLWHPLEKEKVDYFTLADLWSSFDEWSAYGAGVTIVLSGGEALVQYYVPYLSAVQIFISSSSLNGLREETESTTDSETRDSFSDSCTDKTEWRLEISSSSEDGGSEPYNPSNLNNRLGYLYFEYFEKSSPYDRLPLKDKINELSRGYPGLMSLRSVDLSPASWMSIAWYPIYHIPAGRTVKDLSTCFLTYHTLSSSFQDVDVGDEMDLEIEPMKRKPKSREGNGIALDPFGLATYKMQGSVWMSSSGKSCRDKERLMALSSVADSWLKQLRVQHHDFNYFMRIEPRLHWP